jgi:hypothetical protein
MNIWVYSGMKSAANIMQNSPLIKFAYIIRKLIANGSIAVYEKLECKIPKSMEIYSQNGDFVY